MTQSPAEWPTVGRAAGVSLSDPLADRALTRTTGAALISGNRVRILRNAEENYPAWLEAIRTAQHSIRFEQYMVRDDSVGRRFADAVLERASAGVAVRFMYDWFGSFGTAGRSFWRRLQAGGVEVEVMAPPRLDHPFAFVRRDHRKAIVVDDRIAFVSGLCLAEAWEGDAAAGIEPWRDTGLALEGPAVAEVARAFDTLWTLRTGRRAPEITPQSAAGDVPVRVIASAPSTSGLFRLDQLIAATATQSLWLSDAYYVGTSAYVQALRAASQDGVDVRLLVPNAGDVKLLRPLSRAGYRPLLEAGVRVFEWNGVMLHAKTAVADGRWCRVGSTNLNVASWIGNWELDVAIEHFGTASMMAAQFEADLTYSTEILLRPSRWGRRAVAAVGSATPPMTSEAAAHPVDEASTPGRPDTSREVLHDERMAKRNKSNRLARVARGTSRRAAAGALRIGNAVGAALLDRRMLGPAEARVDLTMGLVAIGVAGIAILWPRFFAWPVALTIGWLGLATIVRALAAFARERRRAKVERIAAAAHRATDPGANR